MISIIPLNDERPHIRAQSCWCSPLVQWLNHETGMPWENGPHVIHTAQDGREACECVTGESLDRDKKWAVFED